MWQKNGDTEHQRERITTTSTIASAQRRVESLCVECPLCKQLLHGFSNTDRQHCNILRTFSNVYRFLDAIAHKCGNINLNVGKNEKKRQEYYNKDRRHGVELLRVECPLCKQRFRGFINYWLHCKRIHNISVPPELTTPTFAHASQPQPTDRRVPPAGVKAKKQKVRRLGSNRTVDNGSGHGAPAAATVVKRESESSDGVDSASRPTTSYDDVVVVAGEESHPAGQVYAMSVGHMRERDAAVNGATKAVSSGDFHKLLEVIRHTLNYAHCRSFLEGRASPPFLDSNSLPSEVYIRFIRDQLIRDIHEEKQRRDSEIRSHRSDATQNPVSARLANMAGAHQHTRTLFEVESLLQVVSAYESIVLSRSAHQWYGHPSVSPYNVHEHNRTLAGVHDDTPVGTRTLCVPPLRGDFVSGGHRPEPNERQHGGSFGSRNRESAVSSSLPSLSDILSSGGVAIARSQHSPSVPGGRVADSHRPSVSDRPPLERDSRSRSRSPDSRIGKPSGTDDRRREYSSDVDPRPTKRLRTSPSSSSDHTRPPGHVTSQRSDESQESMRLYTSSAMRRHHRGTFPLSTSAAETVDDIEVRARQVELEARARAVAGADAMHALANESEGSQHETTPTAHRPSQPPSSSTRRHRSSTVHPPSLPSRRVFTLTPLASPRASAVGGSEADSDTDTRNRVTSPRSGARKRTFGFVVRHNTTCSAFYWISASLRLAPPPPPSLVGQLDFLGNFYPDHLFFVEVRGGGFVYKPCPNGNCAANATRRRVCENVLLKRSHFWRHTCPFGINLEAYTSAFGRFSSKTQRVESVVLFTVAVSFERLFVSGDKSRRANTGNSNL